MNFYQLPEEKWAEALLFHPSSDQTCVVVVSEPSIVRSGWKVIWTSAASLCPIPFRLSLRLDFTFRLWVSSSKHRGDEGDQEMPFR